MELSETDKVIQTRINSIIPLLNERQNRIYVGAEAYSIGWGGITKIHQLSGVNRQTIAAGIKEISQANKQEFENVKIRKKGGGRKNEIEKHPELLEEIKEIVSPHTMGDPEKPSNSVYNFILNTIISPLK